MPKPYTLSGEPTAAMVEQIDEMFHLLFQETAGITQIGADGTFLRSDGETPSWGLIEETDIQDGDLLARVAGAEAITGAWTFSQDVLPATDDGPSLGSGSLRWDTLHAMIVSATTRVTTPLITTASGALGITPASGSAIVATLLGGATATFDITAPSTTGTMLRLLNTDTGGKTWRLISSGSGNGGGAGNLLINNLTDNVTVARISSTLFDVMVDAGLGIIDTNASHFLRLDCGSNLTADRILSFVTGDEARTITMTGNPTLVAGTMAITGGTLAQFAATTSLELKGVISDETGSGALVFATSPTLTTPVISGAISFPDNTRQTFNPGADAAGLNVGAIAGDPGTPVDGDVWYDSTANELTARINGANVALGAGGSGGGERTPQRSSATGAQADFDLTDGHTWLILDGAAPVISGFEVGGTTPSDGDSVLIDYIGTGTCRVEDESTGTGSTAANRCIWPSERGQIVSENGRMLCVYDGTTGRWRGAVIETGAPIAVSFNAGDFTAFGSMTWTVEAADVLTFTYVQTGKRLQVRLVVVTTTMGGTPSNRLLILLPNSFSAVKWTAAILQYEDNGTFGIGYIDIGPNATQLNLWTANSANWTASTDNTTIRPNAMEFEIK